MTEHLPEFAVASSPGIVRQALAFIKNPRAIRPEAEPLNAQLKPLLGLYALNLGVLFLLLPLLMAWTKWLGIQPPQMTKEIPELLLLLLTVLILPPLEEIVFRGWLLGKPWQLFALAVLALGGIGLGTAQAYHSQALALSVLALMVAALIAGIWTLRRKSEAPGWFTRNFRWWYWGSAVVFASAHYSNYNSTSLAHLPVVLPQLWSGLVFGFVRLRFGILRSMTLHMASNAFVLGAFFLVGIPGA